MTLKKYQKIAVFSFIFVFAVSTVILSASMLATADAPTGSTADENDEVATAPTTEIETVPEEEPEDPEVAIAGKKWTGNGNKLNLKLLRVGDIICVKGVIKIAGLAEWYMGYGHCAVYIGNGKMVEAFSDGVRVMNSKMIHNADCAELLRVRTSNSKKQAAVNFMLKQVGKPYDYQWTSVYFGGKEVYGSSYYCSELAWAGYKVAGGPDIDRNPGFHWKYGPNVAPQEVADDRDTYRVSYSK